ncbi:MAG TPA: metallophosphoesterase [Gemmatimonadales bacterium]|nr:metallophosphoesterase [Gemmatimonadales bacterium]
MTDVVVAHISDIHFGGRADLPQVAVLERFLPGLSPRVIVVSGDLCQRARHGEFQAASRYLDGLARTAPVHVVPGNHDVQWWRSPLGIAGRRVKFEKFRHYFGEDLTPVLELDDVIVVGMLSAHGLAWGSLTFNPNDTTVRGHLPASEVARARRAFAAAPPGKVRIASVHHNVLPGVVSGRWGLARPLQAQRRLLTLEADLVVCGHDHTEGAGQIAGRLAVSTAGTHSLRTRGGRPSAFNLIRIGADRVQIEHYVYDRDAATFHRRDTAIFARSRSAALPVA